ncbi:heavy metal transporter [Streptomonospora sediminis]
MPRKQRKVSAFFKILLALTVVCGALVGGGYYVLSSIEPLEVEEPEPVEACTISTGSGGKDRLDPDQAANAATISGVAFSRDLARHAVVVAYATVWQESKFYNIDYGDRDSVGLFQQRPSQRWGEPDELMDPVYAADAFYDKLVDLNAYNEIPVYEAAQAVQRSADGFAYDQHVKRSETMADAFTGASGPALSCVLPNGVGKADLDGAREEMQRVFGADPGEVPPSGSLQTGDLGWAMAQWAVANAKEYGISSVTYEDQRWQAKAGKQGWQTVPDAAPRGEVVLE